METSYFQYQWVLKLLTSFTFFMSNNFAERHFKINKLSVQLSHDKKVDQFFYYGV